MGLLDNLNNEWSQLGMGILANNNSANFTPALMGGMNQLSSWQQQQLAQAKAEEDRAYQQKKRALEMQTLQSQATQNTTDMKHTGGLSTGLYKHLNPNLKTADSPSNVREWQYYNSLPETDKEQYLRMKRADKFWDNGQQQGVFNNVTNKPTPLMNNQLKPGELPATKAAQASAATAAKMSATDKTQAKLDLPQVESDAVVMNNLIDAAINHPGLSRVTGVMGALPNMPGSAGSDAQAAINQIKGKVFMSAYQSLKGGGTITEVEGKKAEDALAALEQSQSTESLVNNLSVLKSEITRLSKLAKDRAGSDVKTINWADMK